MSSTYTTTQATVSFTATADSWSESSGSDVAVKGFPGGDAVAVSIGGQRETRRTFKVLFPTTAAYILFRSMRARQGMLYVENWDTTAVGAILTTTAPDAIQGDGQVVARAEFVLT